MGSNSEMFSDEFVTVFRGNKKGQFGYWYNPTLKTLIVGKIDEDFKLSGEVVGCDFDGALRAYDIGYRYHDWGQHEFEYVGKTTTFTTLKGYLDFIKDADYEQLKSYFKAKLLLEKEWNRQKSK